MLGLEMVVVMMALVAMMVIEVTAIMVFQGLNFREEELTSSLSPLPEEFWGLWRAPEK